MKKIELDIRCISTVKALHIYLQYMLDLPSYYGRNLDALYDLLSTESDSTAIMLTGPAPAGSEMENDLPKLIGVFEDCARENEKLKFEVKE